ncbi:MAG: glycoside hydrolase family 38 C-terminal domain-containing protein, partial [Armatimonadota bacterium]|nr:glycoside hydrolase family 38 C-terminal domain-containing protein [Armatimonadota bacterium]
TLLEKWAEPSSALAYAFGKKYEPDFIWLAWKLCLQNHPHDSICGCSIDQVHREMMPRFEQSQQIGEVMTRESLAHLAGQVNTVFDMPEKAAPVVVFNALNWDVNEPVTVRMSHLLETEKAPGHFVVRDPEGRVIASQVSNPRRTELHRHGLWWDCDLSFNPGSVSSLGYKTFSIERVDFKHIGGQPPLSGVLVASENSLENEYVKVVVASNGSFDLLDKMTENLFTGLNLFEDTEDAGDEYDYTRARASRTITSSGAAGTITLTESGPVFATIRVDTQLRLPVGLSVDRYTRSEETVICPISAWITVRKGSPRVDIVTEVTNNAKDHRLRVWFPAGVKAAKSQVEGQFDVVERSIDMLSGADWHQKPQPEQPQQSFANVEHAGRGLTVINQGLPECEVMRSGDAIIALTLLRCCGWLSTADLLTRDNGAGPEIKTPDAQCLGKHTFRYAVLPHAGDWKKAQVWRHAHQHNVPLRPIITSVHPGRQPREKSFIRVEPANLIVSALKKSDRDGSLILRIYNTTGEDATASIKVGFPIKSGTLANLNEEPVGKELNLSDEGSFSFDMPAFRVQTLRMSL